MKDLHVTKDQLLNELAALRVRVGELEALGQAEGQIELILGATKTGLDIIDSHFNIRYIDPVWKKVYGEPTGRKCYEYIMDRNQV